MPAPAAVEAKGARERRGPWASRAVTVAGHGVPAVPGELHAEHAGVGFQFFDDFGVLVVIGANLDHFLTCFRNRRRLSQFFVFVFNDDYRSPFWSEYRFFGRF